jgi:hypothetical protein
LGLGVEVVRDSAFAGVVLDGQKRITHHTWTVILIMLLHSPFPSPFVAALPQSPFASPFHSGPDVDLHHAQIVKERVEARLVNQGIIVRSGCLMGVVAVR